MPIAIQTFLSDTSESSFLWHQSHVPACWASIGIFHQEAVDYQGNHYELEAKASYSYS